MNLYPQFTHFVTVWMKVDESVILKLAISKECIMVWDLFIMFGMEELHVMPFSGLQFCETHWNERHTLLQGINRILPTCSMIFIHMGCNSV
jgi:hypothetical protein